MWKLIKQYFMPIYVSETDSFLEDYDKKHPQQSLSQRKEFERFQEIYKLRDGQNTAP